MKRLFNIFLCIMLLFTSVLVTNISVYADDGDTEAVTETGEEEILLKEDEDPAEIVIEEDPETKETEETEKITAEPVEALPPVYNTDSVTSGSAYAILQNNGNLLFFRSSETYEAGNDKTVTINGETYTGTLFTNVEVSTANDMFAYNPSITSISVAADHQITPKNTWHYFWHLSESDRLCAEL